MEHTKLKVFEAFAGYGSQSMALEKLGIDFQVIGISEIDKYAIQAYMAVHGDTPNYGDISKIEWDKVPDFDFLTYSFPCTDISNAGLQKGLEEGSGTRSSLLWECTKAIEAKKPKYLLMENVKALTNKKFKPYLNKWLDFLSSLGYSNYMQVLNAKNYGVPQNRDRVFVVSIMGDEKYDFPKPFELEKRLKDVLESNVDESFYLKKKVIDTFLRRNTINEKRGNGFRWSPTDGDCVAKAVTSNAGSRDCDNYIYVVGNVNPSGKGMNGNVFDSEFLCPTLTTNKGEGPKILEPFIKQYPRGFNNGFEYKNGYAPAITTSSWENNNFLVEPVTCAMRGRNPDNPSDRRSGIPMQQRIEVGGNVANCLTTVQKDSMVLEPQAIGYTRDKKGKVVSRHLQDYVNTVHTSTGSGGNTDCFILEPSILTPRRTEYGKAIRKYYEAGKFKESRHNMTALEPRKDGISNTITTVQKDNLLVEPTKTILGISVNPVSRKLEFKGCKSICAISPALRATDYKCPHTVWIKQNLHIPQATSKGYIEVAPGGVFDGSYPESKTRRGRVQEGGKVSPTLTAGGEPPYFYEGVLYKGRLIKEGDGLYLHNSKEFDHGSLDGISRTLKATKFDAGVVQGYRIRKLTPRECFRLMGVSESDIDKIQEAGISKTQQYKMAGNSIVVDVLYYIFNNLFMDRPS